MLSQVLHHAAISTHRPLFARLLSHLVAADASYRDSARLRQMSPERLADMGLVRRGAADTPSQGLHLGW